MRVENLKFGPLSIESFEILDQEFCCVVGANASGKSLFAAVLAGERDTPEACWSERPDSIRLVSAESAQARYEEERRLDDTDFLDSQDWGTTGLALLQESGATADSIARLSELFHCTSLLNRGCRQFSSGEWRRIELLTAVLARPRLLILDEPFDSLDQESRQQLMLFLLTLKEEGQAILLLVNRLQDVPEFCDHLALLQKGKIVVQGHRAELLTQPAFAQLFEFDESRSLQVPEPLEDAAFIDPLVRANQLTLTYDGVAQFAPFDWVLRPGQHTRISGPNGCGKSSLLQLLSGDHPQCYGNDLFVVGFQRGSGESIWDVKKRIGLVSPALHRDYRAPASVLSVIASGLFDSIGVYRQISPRESAQARAWLDVFDLGELSSKNFRELSYGQQRLALIARALIKQPPLLILDEPTQGLDDLNRKLVLAYLQRLTELKRSTLLFVSHLPDEVLKNMSHELRFVESHDGNSRYSVRLTSRA